MDGYHSFMGWVLYSDIYTPYYMGHSWMVPVLEYYHVKKQPLFHYYMQKKKKG